MLQIRFQLALAVISLVVSSQASAQGYQFTALTVPGGTSLGAFAVNNSGQVAGSAYVSLGFSQAVVWEGSSSVTVLNALGGTSRVVDINAGGQSAGDAFVPGLGRRAVIWQGTTSTLLTQPMGALDSVAVSINDSGQVAGQAAYFNLPSQAIRWTQERPVLLDSRGGRSSVATGINYAGDIAGYIENIDGSGLQKPVVWHGTEALVLNSLTESVCCNRANGINDKGRVAGQSSLGTAGTVRAVVWNGVEPTALAALSDADVAFALNNVGQVVGAMNAGGGFRTAALWNLNTGTGVDLNSFLSQAQIDAGWVLYTARDINDYGVIVGDAFNSQIGSFRPFLLTPVPEQGTRTLLLAGMMALAYLRGFARSRRQQRCCRS